MALRTWLLAALVAVGAGIVILQRTMPPPPAPPEPVLTLHERPEVRVDEDAPSFAAAIHAALEAADYVGLEAQAAAYRAPDALFLSGIPKLYRFYMTLAEFATEHPDDNCSPAIAASLDETSSRLERWRRAAPASTTAKIAVATFWDQAAWNARGCDSDVAPEAWRTARDRLAEAEAALADVDLDDDAMAYYVFIGIGALRGFDRDRFDDLYERATESFPRFFPLYGQRANFIQEKWFGEAGELVSYLKSLRDPAKGPDGAVAFTFAVDRVFGGCACKESFDSLGHSLGDIIAAYQVREERYGLSNRDWNVIFGLAIYGGACEPAHQALLQIGDRWDRKMWKEKKYFDENVAWFHAHSRY